MADLGLIWKDGYADLALVDGDLHPGSELESNILVSLFSDARSKDPAVVHKRGYWARVVGSRIWEMFRQPATLQNLQIVIQYCKDALQWMIDTEIAQDLKISGLIFNRMGFYIEIEVLRGTNKKYDYLYNGLKNRTYDFDESSIIIKYQV